MMIPVEISIYESSRTIMVDAMIDTHGVHFAPRLTRQEKQDIYNGCEVHLFHPRTGRRLKKLEKRVDLENVRLQIREAGAY